MDKRIALLALAIATIGLVGTYTATRLAGGGDFSECRGGVVGGDIGGPFTLVDETGREVTDEEILDLPALVYFGYTFCPDFCPLDALRNGRAVELLDERGLTVRPVFVSVDPARDTPEVLAQYTDNFHDRMIGLTGSEAQVAAAAREWRVPYQIVGDDPEFYTVNHSTLTYLTLPAEGFVDFVRSDATEEEVADRMECFVNLAAS